MREYVNDLMDEVKKRMVDAGTTAEGSYTSFIDEVVDEWISSGQIHEDENIEGLKELAREMWSQVSEELEEE